MITTEYRIKDIGEVVGGGTPRTDTPEYWNGNIPWLSPVDLSNYSNIFISKGQNNITELGLKKSSTKLLPKDTVLLSSRAPIGYLAIAENEICTNQGFKSIICDKKKVVPLFLYYYLKLNIEQLKSFASGATFPELSGNTLKKIKIQLPPLPTQQKIASILSAYDNLIQNYKKQIEALQTGTCELYKEWFVRFRFPDWQTTRFENGIPEGWKVIRLSDFCKVTDGTHDTPDQVDEGIPLVTGKAVKNGEIDFSIPYNISIEDHEKIKKRSGLKTGDILFSNIGTVGNSCLVEYDREFSVKNMIIFKPETIEKSMYLYYLITSDSCQQLFSAQTNGSTQQFLGLDFMRNFKILVPENSIISEFGKKQEVIYAKIRNLRKQITNLTQQRDLLLPRLMSGKLEVE